MALEVSLRGDVVTRGEKCCIALQHSLDLGERPDVELALLTLRIGVERGRKGAFGRGHLAREPADGFLRALEREGAYIATAEEKAKLQAVLWENGHVSRKVVARPVGEIAALAGIAVPADRTFIVVEEEGTGAEHPFSGEKLSLVLTCYKYEAFEDAVALVNAITGYSGSGHSCGIHSNDADRILQLGLETKTSRVIVRQPHGVANSGSWSNGLAKTFSLGCGSWGGNSVSENVTQKHYYNTTRIAEPLDRAAPDDAAIYGPLFGKIAAVRIAAGA